MRLNHVYDICRIRPEYIKHVKGVSIIHVQFQVSRDLMRLSFSESFPLLYVKIAETGLLI